MVEKWMTKQNWWIIWRILNWKRLERLFCRKKVSINMTIQLTVFIKVRLISTPNMIMNLRLKLGIVKFNSNRKLHSYCFQKRNNNYSNSRFRWCNSNNICNRCNRWNCQIKNNQSDFNIWLNYSNLRRLNLNQL